MSRYQRLAEAVNRVWNERYSGHAAAEVDDLRSRVEQLGVDRDRWRENARALQRQVNELEATRVEF